MKSDKFKSELGGVTLASGRLEAELIILLKKNKIKGNYDTATLGALIKIIETNKILESKMTQVLQNVKNQRNYIMHNIYALFSDLIDETILEKHNLLDSDVHLYTERAFMLKENLNSLTDLIKESQK